MNRVCRSGVARTRDTAAMSQDSNMGYTLTWSPSRSGREKSADSPLASTRSISVWGTPRSSISALIVLPGGTSSGERLSSPVGRAENR